MKNHSELTAAQADKVNLFLSAASALPKCIALSLDDGVLTIWKRLPNADGLNTQSEVAVMKRKSFDTWQ